MCVKYVTCGVFSTRDWGVLRYCVSKHHKYRFVCQAFFGYIISLLCFLWLHFKTLKIWKIYTVSKLLTTSLCVILEKWGTPPGLTLTCESECILGMFSVASLASRNGSTMFGRMTSPWPITWRQEVYLGKPQAYDFCFSPFCDFHIFATSASVLMKCSWR